MQSMFGWALLSRDALRRAETQLRDDVEGVRDEIGFLALHQAFADRFFPGTSVLHTRLRYALFVPWIYARISRLPARQRIAQLVEKQELELTRRLKQAGESNVIGIRSYPNPTAQPPSMTYWSALGTWRILRPAADGTLPSRQTVHRRIARGPSRTQLQDDDHQPLVEDEPIFVSLPDPPPAWTDTTLRLDCRLTKGEAQFLRNCLLAVDRPGEPGTPSLLSRLVERNVPMGGQVRLWSDKVRSAADALDRDALVLAGNSASLAAIGRAIYAALVEEMRDQHDRVPTEHVHRDNLRAVISEHKARALALNVDQIRVSATSVPAGLLELLKSTQQWLHGSSRPLADLYAPYEAAESRRKGRRARLSRTLFGQERRLEWVAQKHPRAGPLHYRWNNVRRLLLDLQESL
ncbi:MAG: hypothetical protein J5I93_05640 [Pirellulaceae bacterium]|nr:hypothetical protein [Pirellulaceae bacterium]